MLLKQRRYPKKLSKKKTRKNIKSHAGYLRHRYRVGERWNKFDLDTLVLKME